MNDYYFDIKNKLKDFKDKVFFLPVHPDDLTKIERKYNIKIPKAYLRFLSEFGFIQNVTSITQTEDSLIDNLDYVIDKFPGYFPIGISENAEILFIINQNDNEQIYEISTKDIDVNKTKKSLQHPDFESYLKYELNELIKNSEYRISDHSKVRCFEFSITINNFEPIVKLLKSRFSVKWIDKQWKDKYYPNILKLKFASIEIDQTQIFVEKDCCIDSETVFRIEFIEPLSEIVNLSKAEIIKDIFDNNGINYEMIDSGILESDDDNDDDDFL
jgi:hypothetical protein